MIKVIFHSFREADSNMLHICHLSDTMQVTATSSARGGVCVCVCVPLHMRASFFV